MKKQLTNRTFMATCTIAFCFILTSCGNGTTETITQTETHTTTISTTAETLERTEAETTVESESEVTETEELLSFELTAGEQNEYSQLYVYNENTEFEDKKYVYFVPYGTYKVTNIGDYMTQVNIYSDEKNTTDEGWEEPANANVKLIDVNDSAEITVSEDYHIDIDEPTHVLFEMISESGSTD